jgi:membrane peptidoglycan carboxypeptidase
VVTRIATRDGRVLYERRGSGLGQAVMSYDVSAMNDMLRAVVTSGTGRRAALSGRDIAGKTGTSQDYRDAWFIGYSAQLVAGVWAGNDDNSPTKRVTGGNLPAGIWKDVMEPAHAGLDPCRCPATSGPRSPPKRPGTTSRTCSPTSDAGTQHQPDNTGIFSMFRGMFGGGRPAAAQPPNTEAGPNTALRTAPPPPRSRPPRATGTMDHLNSR